MSYETVIGLEVHAQLLTESKLFCLCSTRFGADPNANTCPVCLGLPGTLPVLNQAAVELALRLGLAAGCEISQKNVFARKNYFYPDLPKGYQISQYELPICRKGSIEIPDSGGSKKIRLTRIHMEEDAGKLLHEHPITRSKSASWVDLNRASVPLLEIVSEPELRNPEEAVVYLKELRRILMYLKICDGNMEEGSLRCDANISLRPLGETKLGTRVELKNMNSFRHIEEALGFEVERQKNQLDQGKPIVQETRLWDPKKEETSPMRAKEEAHDYRYFPDPDLLPVEIDAAWLERVKADLPELPSERRGRFHNQYRLPPSQIDILVDQKEYAEFFEKTVEACGDAPRAANWVINDFLRMVKGDPALVRTSRLKPSHLSEAFQMVDQGRLSAGLAKSVLQKVFETGRSPGEIVSSEGLEQIADTGQLERMIDLILGESSKEVSRYQAGEGKLLSFFLGQVMKKTQGRADPKLAEGLLKKKLGH